jgi:hypothetical protein
MMKKIFIPILSALIMAVLLATACSTSPSPAASKPDEAKPTPEAVARPVIQPPLIKDILGPKEAAVSENTTVTCWAVDPDGRKLTFLWSVDAGTIKANGRDAVWATPSTPGSYTINVKITNDAGLDASMSKQFKVVAVPDSHKFTDNTIYLKMTLQSNDTVRQSVSSHVMTANEIQCLVADQDPAQLTYKWNAPIGKLAGPSLAEGKAARVGWVSPGTPGQYTVGVTVTDKAGHQATGEVNFDVIGDY